MIAQVIGYEFTPILNKIVLKDIQQVDLSKVQYIHNTTRNISLYNYSSSSPLVSLGTNVIIVPVSCAGMSYTDDLEITYDFDISPSSNNDRQILTLPIPSMGSIIYVVASKKETIVSFTGNIVNNFSIFLSSSGNIKGDRLYLMGKGDSTYTIPLLGVFNNIMCGGPEANWEVTVNNKVLEFIWDGEFFTGIDNC